MGGIAKRRPTFFKVMMGDFANKLRLPNAFVKGFNNIMSNTFFLKSRVGNTALVSVVANRRGHFLKRGWRKFVKDHNLKETDFLIFNFVGNRTFEVLIYDLSGCEKRMNHSTKAEMISPQATTVTNYQRSSTKKQAACSSQFEKKSQVSHKDAGEEEKSKIGERGREAETILSVQPNYPHFVNVMKNYQKYHICVPRAFARKVELIQKKTVVIKDPLGREFPIRISVANPNSSYCQIWLCKGWSTFVRENEIVDGDTCVFHHKKQMDNVIHVDIHRTAAPRASGIEASAAGMGRPIKEVVEEDFIVID